MYVLRDSVHHMQFVRRYVDGAYPIEIFMSQSGDATWADDVKQNVWDSCFWNIQTPAAATYPGLNWQDGMSSDTLRWCVIKADQGPGAYIELMRTANVPAGQAMNVIDHCTFYGRASGSDGPLTLSLTAADWPSGVGLKITNSIFYTGAQAQPVQHRLHVHVPTGRFEREPVPHYAARRRASVPVDGGAATSARRAAAMRERRSQGGAASMQSRRQPDPDSRAGSIRRARSVRRRRLGGTEPGRFRQARCPAMRRAVLDLSWRALPRPRGFKRRGAGHRVAPRRGLDRPAPAGSAFAP